MAINYTPILNLAKPDFGTINWDTYPNGNMDILDLEIGSARGSMGSLDGRLSVSLNADGTLKTGLKVDILQDGIEKVTDPAKLNFVNGFVITETPAGTAKIDLNLNSLTEKTVLVGNDIFLLEDSETLPIAFLKKKVQISNIDHTLIKNIGTNTHAQIDSHISGTLFVHGITNTSDLALKSGSIAQFTTKTHSLLTSLLMDDHTQYLLLAGRATGQIAYGGTQASENLTLDSTAHATKGYIILSSNTHLNTKTLYGGIASGGNMLLDSTTDATKGVVQIVGSILDMNTHKIINVVDPTANQEAATKYYVDSVSKLQRSISYSWASGTTPYILSAAVEWTTGARFVFRGTTLLGIPTNMKIIGWAGDASYYVQFRVQNITNGTTIATSAQITSTTPSIIDLGILSNLPTGEALFEMQLYTSNSTSGREIYCSALNIQF